MDSSVQLLAEYGYSRDHRSDCKQIIIGIVTSYEGYPIKHYIFEGNVVDSTTVQEVIKDLKFQFNIEENQYPI
jgi:transposase